MCGLRVFCPRVASLAPIDISLAPDGPPGDPVSGGQPEVPISASDQPDVVMDE